MNKIKTMSFRVTEEEYKKINTLAKQNGYSLSSYIVKQSLQDNHYGDSDLSVIPAIRNLLSKLEHEIIRKKEYIKEMRRLLNGK